MQVLMGKGLRDIPLTQNTVHLCIDMQQIFSPNGLWATPWMSRVLPVVCEIASRFPDRTVFTRFMTPRHSDEVPGMWRIYYERWHEAMRGVVEPQALELMPSLAKLVPPATVFDRMAYSAFSEPGLIDHLRQRSADALIVTGSETDMCVLASVLSAVDQGYRVILVRDALCSSSDEGHDAMLKLYHHRYSEQIETADMEEVLAMWR